MAAIWLLGFIVSIYIFSNPVIATWGPNPNGLLRQNPLIDGHNDFPIWIRAFYQNHIYRSNFSDSAELFGQVDFPRLSKGGLSAQFWSVYVECPAKSGHEDEVYHETIHDTMQQIDLVHRLIDAFPHALRYSLSSRDILSNHRSAKNRVSSLLGIEGLHQIGNSASVLRLYHKLGVRYATLTHTCHNKYADSEAPKHPLHYGLSSAGYDLVKELNRLGMIVDISHTSFDTQRDVFEVANAPVIYSHSNAFQLCEHSRNVPDDLLFQLKANDGVIMVTFYPEYTNCVNPHLASLSNVADHIQYIGNLIGYRHVGIGSDFDGMPSGPRGLEDVSKYPDLIEELLRRGLEPQDVMLVMGLNIVRVLEEVEAVAEAMVHVRPLEDDVKPFF